MEKYVLGGLGGVQPPINTVYDKANVEGDPIPERKRCLMIFGGPEAHMTKHQVMLVTREVYAAVLAIPTYLRWLESAITYDSTDHPDHVPHPGRNLLVVMPIVGRKRLSRVLMDGGSGLNILYTDTLDALSIPIGVAADPGAFLCGGPRQERRPTRTNHAHCDVRGQKEL